MITDSIEFLKYSNVDNVSIVSGATLPVGSIGELFYKTGTDEGLYYYSTSWTKVGTGEGGGIETGATLPAGTYVGQMFTKTGDNANTYMFNGTEWVVMVISVAIESGTLWAWGYNHAGQLGDGTVVPRSSPVQIGTLTDWKQVSCGDYHSHAIKTNGTLWAWGYNASGQLGDGTIVNKSSPIQIGSLSVWKQIFKGHRQSFAVK